MTDGILVVDKPAGITSHDVVRMLRNRFDTRKVGHAGTLDPLATGVLLVGAGRATRLLRYLSGMGKSYEGTGRLGTRTDTLDSDGRVVAVSEVSASRELLVAAAARLTGPIVQTPPSYSAVKVGGRPMYKSAREGKSAAAQDREVTVDSFRLASFDGTDFDFVIDCSSGTYVRSLVASVGEYLGCGAHLTRLRRTRVGPFHLEGASAPEAAELLPVERAVAHLPRIELDENETEAARNGRPLGPAGIEGSYGVFSPQGELVGVYRDDVGKARPEMILAPTG